MYVLNMPETNRWCLGLPFVKARSIINDELNRYISELEKVELRLKRQKWLFVSCAVVAALVSLQFVFAMRGTTESDSLVIFFSIVGICLGIAGIGGTVGEVMFGGRVSRILFAAAIVGLGISFSFNGEWTELLGVCTGMVAVFGGNAMAVRQWQERRRAKRLVQNLRNDLMEGIVWRFEREFPTGEEKSPIARNSADVFPRSNIAVAVNDRPAERLITLNTTAIAAGTGSADAPLSTFAPAEGLDSFDFRQRHLTPEEKIELSGFLRRDLRRLLIRAITLLWSSTALAAGADAIFNRHPSELTARSVFIGAAVVIVFLYNRIRERQSIRSDLRGGVVVVIRPKDANLEGTALEQLPRSRMPWSQLGAPALWRTDRRAGRTTL